MNTIGDIIKRKRPIGELTHEVLVGYYDKDIQLIIGQREIWSLGTLEQCEAKSKQLKLQKT